MIYLYSWCHVQFIRYPGERERKATTQLLCSPRRPCDTFIWEYGCAKRYIAVYILRVQVHRIKNGRVCLICFPESLRLNLFS